MLNDDYETEFSIPLRLKNVPSDVAVSYTHLDVYKRQALGTEIFIDVRGRKLKAVIVKAPFRK